jgi:uncharacterized membrane protein YkvA (DUF1232 family)
MSHSAPDLSAHAYEALKRRSKTVTHEDVVGILVRRGDVLAACSGGGPLDRFLADVELLLCMLRDYDSGLYTQAPWATVAAAATTLAYVLDPVVLVPDASPRVGLVDDAAVLRWCLAAIQPELHAYTRWFVRSSVPPTAGA